MAKTPLPIFSGFYDSKAVPFNAQRCVCYYPLYAKAQSLGPAYLAMTPGILEILEVASQKECRGVEIMDNVPYFVVGTELVRLDRTIDGLGNEVFSYTTLGTIPGNSRVSLAENGTQLCIVVPGNSGYIWDRTTNTFEQITDPGFTANGKSNMVAYVDGYFVHISGKRIFHSDLENGLSYNSLDVGLAAADTDDIVSIVAYRNQLIVLGVRSIEVFGNVNKFPFTFARKSGNFQSVGCSARFSTVVFNNTFAFVGGSKNERVRVYRSRGGEPEVISTPPIEIQLQRLTTNQLEQIYCWTYGEEGGVFLGVQAGNKTFVYDAESSALAGRPIWHERESYIPESESYGRYRVSAVVSAYNKILVGDYRTGQIGELREDVKSEYGLGIRRFVRSQPFYNQDQPVFLGSLELKMNVGTVEDDSDPSVLLRWSDDNYFIEDNYRSASLGKKGQVDKRINFTRLGSTPAYRTFEISVTEPVDATITNAVVRYDTTAE